MLIGITGRGGSGKTTLAKKIVNNHKNFLHIEVDKIIEEELINNQKLIDKVNETVGRKYNKQYDSKDIIDAYFKKDEESLEIHSIFINQLNEILNDKIENVIDKNIVVEHYFLDKFDVYKKSDIKIKLIADLEERVKRVKKRGNMSESLFKKVDECLVENTEEMADFEFNVEDYQKELISVIVPVYNAEKYINETLDAILNQTYENTEIIIVNDGSTDNTLNILNDYSKRDNRIKVITTENKNVSNARNTGLENATGQYIAYVDSDDIIDSNYLSVLYDVIKITDVDYVQSAVSIERNGIPHMVTHNKEQLLVYSNPIEAFLNLDTTFAVWGKLFKKEVINEIKFEDIRCFEDFKYIWEVVKNSKKSAVTGDTSYHYIQKNDKSLTSNLYSNLNKELIDHAFTVLKECNYSNEAKKYFYGCLFHNVMVYYESLKNPKFEDKYQKEIFLCLQWLEAYKDYKFQLLRYNVLDTEEIITSLKEKLGIKTIGILWNSMEEYYDEAMEDIARSAIIDKYFDIEFSTIQFKKFIDTIYPRIDLEHWKTDIKINNIVDKYKNNKIRVVYLTLNKTDRKYVSYKKSFLYSSVLDLKEHMRQKYKDKIEHYQFDNVFHMTDDESEFYITDAIIREIMMSPTRVDGYIILDDVDIRRNEKEGLRKKVFFDNFMFKEIREGSYEDYCELFNEEVLKLLDIDCAFYDLAQLNGKKGVITNLFCDKKDFVSGLEIIKKNCKTDDIREIMKYNNLVSLDEIIAQYLKSNGCYDDYIYNAITEKVRTMLVTDLAMLQSDRNPNNWGIIKKGDHYDLASIFDNSNCANSNHIDRNPFDIDILLKYKNDDSNDVYQIIADHDLKEEVIDILNTVLNNFEYIMSRIELKTAYQVPEKFKQRTFNIYNQHLNNIKDKCKNSTHTIKKIKKQKI